MEVSKTTAAVLSSHSLASRWVAPHFGGFDMLDVGKKAPDFKLKSQDNEEFTLSSFNGEKWVIIHTFPFAFTGG